ncbi:DUF7524 family protein [Halovivax gelatinilyticus]|uniref:DUF7524 family protein n=1 Tax=Halovivax gelatinilyticus TaxID=2961597 RepID=UPI0020CA8D43|nr:hypothetical protein [Halovivax gelatinilyticus]
MTADPIAVHVNRFESGGVEATPPAIETDRSFELEISNHGDPVHVHVHASDELAGVVTVTEANPFVDTDETITLPIRVGGHAGPKTGTIELSTRFGANTSAIDVTLTGGVDPGQRVTVDERLAKPPSRETDDADDRSSAVTPTPSSETLALTGLAGTALLVALAATIFVSGPVAFAGVAIVLAGFLVAGYLLVST